MTTMTAHKPSPPPPPRDAVELADRAADDGDLNDATDNPDTIPDTSQDGELIEAIEWLKRAGVVQQDDRPPFAGFFEEVVNSTPDGEAEH